MHAINFVKIVMNRIRILDMHNKLPLGKSTLLHYLIFIDSK